MPESYLTILDLVWSPLYILVLTAVAIFIRNKHYPAGHPLRKYYLPGLFIKFAGAIFITLIYQYYYGGGDTFNFFNHSKIINSSLDESFSLWLKLIFRVSAESDPYIYKYSSQLFWYDDPATYAVTAIGAVFGLLNGTTYLPIALLFAFFSFTGIWAMFRTFTNIYPSLHKQLAIAFLVIPSTVVWGSAMFKDTICMFGLGWLTYTVFQVFLQKDFRLKNFIMLALSFYLIAVVKIYILLAFLPALFLWLLMSYSGRIKNRSMRLVVNVMFIATIISSLGAIAGNFASELGKYSIENLANTAKITQDYITYVSEVDEGSAYDLGTFEPNLGSMILKFPQAVVVTLFRPFLWEVKKPIMLLSAFEAFAFAAFFLAILYKRGFVKTVRMTASDPNLLFFLVFTLVFSFAVGISSGNFGALSRYKIPCMPFFGAFLLILYYLSTEKQEKVEEKQLMRQGDLKGLGY